MLLAILAAYFGYKKAKESGRNGVAWAAISVGAFIGTQLLFGLIAGFVLAFADAARGGSGEISDGAATALSFAAIIPSFLVVWLIFRFLDRIPEDETTVVPPPPTFE